MEQNFNDHYLVIGAGPCGLAVARALKLAALPYHQAEADDEVGGNWYHGVYETANILSSRRATEYPDYPMPPDYPDFPSATQMKDYYRQYADHYNLRPDIHFNTKVVQVTPIENNLWSVLLADGTRRIYKAVIVCNGHHWSKHYPSFEGEFNGETFHSKDYKSPEQLRGKRVLVIGSGNSAFDIASEAARVGKKCYMSIRRGIWIFPKTFMGKPLSEFQNIPILPMWAKMRLTKLLLRLAVGKAEEYGLPKPTISLFDRHPTINTDTLINIKNGRITVKGAVRKFSGHTATFEDGSSAEIDTVVYATGFNVALPFLPKPLQRVEKNVVKVYGYGMFNDYKGIYIVGWFQPRGGVGSLIGPYAELLAQLLKVQEKFNTPVGEVLRCMGEQLPDTHLFGSVEFLDWMKKKNRQLKKMELLGLKLDSKNKVHSNKALEAKELSQLKDLIVY